MILVFGKTGQVATELQAFRDIKALGRSQADLANPKVCSEAIKFYKPRAVINAAAYTSVDKAESDEDLANTINGDAPGVMAMACAELDIPLVHISTDYVFDGTGTKPWSFKDIPNPQNAYGRSKLRGERLITTSGCKHAIVRTSWIVSAHGNNFVKTMLHISKIRDCLPVVDDQIGGPTCARDIARALVSIAAQLIKDKIKSGVYHYSGIGEVTAYSFMETVVANASQYEPFKDARELMELVSTDTDTDAMTSLSLDCAEIRHQFGIQQLSWREFVPRAVRRYIDLYVDAQ